MFFINNCSVEKEDEDKWISYVLPNRISISHGKNKMAMKMTVESDEFGASIPLTPKYLEKEKTLIKHLYPFTDPLEAKHPYDIKQYKSIKSEYNPLISGYEYPDDIPEAVWYTIEYLRFNLGLEAKAPIQSSVHLGYFLRNAGSVIPSPSTETFTRVIINLNHGEVYHGVGSGKLEKDQKKSALLTRAATGSSYVESDHALVIKKGYDDYIVVRKDVRFNVPKIQGVVGSARTKIRPKSYLRYMIVVDFEGSESGVNTINKVTEMAEKPNSDMKKVAMKAMNAPSTLGVAGGNSGRTLIKFKDLPSTTTNTLSSSSNTTTNDEEGEVIDISEIDDIVNEAKKSINDP